MQNPARLPSLEALATFEVAARHLSFTRAADERFVTQSAVSRQIRALEDDLGVSLFLRGHRTLALTDEAGTWLVGTPAYMSPEQVLDQPLDGRSDVYAMGIMLYRILTGQLPFAAESVSSLVNAHVALPVPEMRVIRANIPAVWQEVVGKALSKDPADRHASAGDFARDVREVATGRWYLRKL